MKKAQTEIISAVIIVVIALGLFTFGYFYLKPILEKKQDTVIVERVHAAFDQLSSTSLPTKIETISKLGGEDVFNLDVSGVWLLNEAENSIQFSFLSRVTKLAEGIGWISLTQGASCPPSIGVVGTDKASVVCARADKFVDRYNLTYKIWYRGLEEPITGRQYLIKLIKHPAGVLRSTSKLIRIFKGRVSEEVIGGKTLISTEVKILLV
jgi:hypothetical protein